MEYFVIAGILWLSEIIILCLRRQPPTANVLLLLAVCTLAWPATGLVTLAAVFLADLR